MSECSGDQMAKHNNKKNTIENKIKELEFERDMYLELFSSLHTSIRDSNMAFGTLLDRVVSSGEGTTLVRDLLAELTEYRINETKLGGNKNAIHRKYN